VSIESIPIAPRKVRTEDKKCRSRADWVALVECRMKYEKNIRQHASQYAIILILECVEIDMERDSV
jgi:hypothetical protein